MLVGRTREIEHLGRAPVPAEAGQGGGVALAAICRDRILERLIAVVEINVDIGRRLVEHLVDPHRPLHSHASIGASIN